MVAHGIVNSCVFMTAYNGDVPGKFSAKESGSRVKLECTEAVSNGRSSSSTAIVGV